MCSDKCLAITHIEMHHSSITLIETDYILSFKSKKNPLKYKHHTNLPPLPRGFYKDFSVDNVGHFTLLTLAKLLEHPLSIYPV